MSDVDWLERAQNLLEFTQGEPRSQSRRAAAIYSSAFEDDPFLNGAFGPLAFIESVRGDCLKTGVGFFDEPLWDLSRGTYELLMPAFLCFRAGGVPSGPLGEAFGDLGEARACRKETPEEARRLADKGRQGILAALEGEIAQPILGPIPSLIRRSLVPYLSLRFPRDEESGGAVDVPFPEVDPGPLDVRVQWLNHTLLPLWQQTIEDAGRPLVARLRRIQTEGWFTRDKLPLRS